MKFTREKLGVVFDSCLGHCFYCGMAQIPFGSWEVDHMTPVARGGSNDLSNLTLSCKSCNRRKGNRTVEEFRIDIHTRALNYATGAMETLFEYHLVADEESERIFEMLGRAEAELVNYKVSFFGEVEDIPRRTDPRFAVCHVEAEQ